MSREHAVIFYDGQSWHVRDLSSRNGTTVDGKRVKDAVRLELNSMISFGSEASAWELVDLAAPWIHAISSAGTTVLGTSSGLFLPSAAQCEAFVSNQDGHWVVEHGGSVCEVSDAAQLALSDGTWTLELTLGDERIVAATAVNPPDQTHLSFDVSPDEEHVELTVENGGQFHVFAHRSHNYLLLLLARARLEDQRTAQVQPTEHGWLETKQLADMLRTNTEQINVWIFRARAQFHKVAPSFADRLIERRPTLGQLRIGFGSVVVR